MSRGVSITSRITVQKQNGENTHYSPGLPGLVQPPSDFSPGLSPERGAGVSNRDGNRLRSLLSGSGPHRSSAGANMRFPSGVGQIVAAKVGVLC